MRIAVWYNLGGGGAKRALHQHVQGLVRSGHDVEVWCPSTARTDFLPLSEVCAEHVDPVDSKAFRGVDRFRDVVVHGLRPGLGLAEMDRHLQRCAEQMRRSGGFDVLFANTCQYNAVPDLAQRTGIPALLYLQEPRRTSYEAHPVLPWVGLPGFTEGHQPLRRKVREMSLLRVTRVLARAEVAAAARYPRVLVNSVFSRESVARAYGVDARVCYLGVDTDLFSPGETDQRGHLLGVGQVVRHKRLDLVVEAVGTLTGDRPRLVWVGDRSDAEYAAELGGLAARLGVSLEIRMSVDDRELVRLYRGARAVVHAARLEPFGYTPVEAAATGVPAVVVAEGGMKETVLDGVTGWVAEPTVEQLGAALAACLSDPDEARRRGARGREVTESRWSLPSAVHRLETHLEDVATALGAGDRR